MSATIESTFSLLVASVLFRSGRHARRRQSAKFTPLKMQKTKKKAKGYRDELIRTWWGCSWDWRQRPAQLCSPLLTFLSWASSPMMADPTRRRTRKRVDKSQSVAEAQLKQTLSASVCDALIILPVYEESLGPACGGGSSYLQHRSRSDEAGRPATPTRGSPTLLR